LLLIPKSSMARRSPDFFTSLAAFRGATHIRLRSRFSGQSFLLMGYLERKDLDFTQHRLLFPLPSLSEAADLLLANFSPHTGFLVCFDHGGLVRSGSLDWPSLRHRPAALFSGCDEQYLEVILARPKRKSCKLFELHRANPPKALEQTALAAVPGGSWPRIYGMPASPSPRKQRRSLAAHKIRQGPPLEAVAFFQRRYAGISISGGDRCSRLTS
jgi:hypothetical protein